MSDWPYRRFVPHQRDIRLAPDQAPQRALLRLRAHTSLQRDELSCRHDPDARVAKARIVVNHCGDTRVDLRQTNGAQQVFLDGEDVTTAIRTPEVAQAASKVAVISGVRKVLVAEQRRAGEKGRRVARNAGNRT